MSFLTQLLLVLLLVLLLLFLLLLTGCDDQFHSLNDGSHGVPGVRGGEMVPPAGQDQGTVPRSTRCVLPFSEL